MTDIINRNIDDDFFQSEQQRGESDKFGELLHRWFKKIERKNRALSLVVPSPLMPSCATDVSRLQPNLCPSP